MQAIFDKVFGASWGPSMLGYLTAFIVELDVFAQHDGLPDTFHGWAMAFIGILAGVFGRMTKQNNVTNAKAPGDAKPVPADVKA